MDDLISAERLSWLVGLIYDSAIDKARWPIAMEAIRTELDFSNSTLNLQHFRSGEVVLNVTTNIPEQYLGIMLAAGPDVVEQWGGEEVLRAWPMNDPAVLRQVNPSFDPATSTNGYYLRFAKPQGLVDVLAIGLARDNHAFGSIAFGRHESAGPIGEREITIARLLIPHLQRAATINRLLDTAVAAHATFAAALDQLTVPVVLTAADLSIVHANPAAQQLMVGGDLIRNRHGILGAKTVGVASALAAAVAHAAHDEGSIGRKGLGIPVRQTDGSSSALYILPLRAGRTSIDNGAVAAVFVAQAETSAIAPTEIVSALFSLTPAEGRVFERIASGSSVIAAAASIGIAASTVKTHLLRIYDKVGVRRQAELVQVATSLAI